MVLARPEPWTIRSGATRRLLVLGIDVSTSVFALAERVRVRARLSADGQGAEPVSDVEGCEAVVFVVFE